jgi:hypothetical protein
MNFRTCSLAAVAGLFVAACGGGGGGGSPVLQGSTTPQAVVITQSNAKPVGANALGAAQDMSASDSASLVTGVEVQAPVATSGGALLASRVARAFASSAQRSSLATGVAVSGSQACPLGGSVSLSGNVAGNSGLVAGDNLTIAASNCSMTLDGVTGTLNGQLTVAIVSGSILDLPPFHGVMRITATNLSVQTGAITESINGDMELDINASSATIESLTVSGQSLTSRTTRAGGASSSTLKNYSQSIVVSGTSVTSTLSASVETDSTRVGASGGSYTVTTPTPIVWNSGTGAVTSGSIKVVGAANSQLLLTVGSGDVVTLQVDANGDNTYETTLTSTGTELAGLR